MLSPRAEQTITDYFNLPFPGITGVRCPYFNNTRLRQRGQLRVLVGKGTPREIVEEAHIISIQYHAGFFERDGSCCLHNRHTGQAVTPEDIRHFLIKYNIGIECSGFVTNVLREHFRETKNIDFTKKLHIISPRRLARWLISRLRPVENIGVRTYTDDRNTAIIKQANNYAALQPGDLITMLETGPTKKRNHILLVTDNDGKIIRYAHARAWTSEGQFGHGVSRGTITITKPEGGLLEQTWTEKDLVNENNETYLEAKNANRLEIRRLRQ